MPIFSGPNSAFFSPRENSEGAGDTPCLACSGFCCREFRVYLFPVDLCRLAGHLPLAPSEFCLPVPLTDRNGDYAPFSFSLGAEERFVLGLKRNAGGCRFRTKRDQALQCGVHAFRPLACRSYPFIAHNGKLRLVSQAVCPAPWPLSPQEHREGLRLDKELSREGLRYQAFLETWHEIELPRLNQGRGAEAIPLKAFRQRFRRFLDVLSAFAALAALPALDRKSAVTSW